MIFSGQCNLSKVENHEIVLISIQIVLIIFQLFMFILCVYVTYRRKPLQNINNFILLNLLCADLIPSTISQPIRIYGLICSNHNLASCQIVVFILRICTYVTMSSMLLLCVERYCKITAPLSFGQYFSWKKVCIAVGLIWTVSIVIGLAGDINWNLLKGGSSDLNQHIEHCSYNNLLNAYYGFISMLLINIFPIIAMAVIYTKTFFEVRHILQSMDIILVRHKEHSVAADVQVAITGVLILVSYCIMVLPIVIMDMNSFRRKISNKTMQLSNNSAFEVMVYLVMMYPAVESIIAVCTNAPYRNAFFRYATFGVYKADEKSKSASKTISIHPSHPNSNSSRSGKKNTIDV